MEVKLNIQHPRSYKIRGIASQTHYRLLLLFDSGGGARQDRTGEAGSNP